MTIRATSHLNVFSAAFLLIFSAGCEDHDGSSGTPGEGGEAGEPAGEHPGASGAGDGATGGTMGNGGSGSTVTPLEPGEPCSSDHDCDDGLYCNGLEKCLKAPGSDFTICQVPEKGPCSAEACDEAQKRCDCSYRNGDADGDGVKSVGCAKGNEPRDCDDDDAQRSPAYQEKCDPKNLDEDCKPETFGGKEGDKDGDNYIDVHCANFLTYSASRVRSADDPKNSGSDCDDTDPTVYPGAEEVCDFADNNCNGQPDELSGAPSSEAKLWYHDKDGDTFGGDEPEDELQSLCSIPPPGYVPIKGDCADDDAHRAPSRAEVCNGLDDDCDDTIDVPLKPGTLMLDEPYDGVTKFECRGDAGWAVKECPSDRLDCDQSYLNACEVPANTLCNCHACGRECSFSCGAADCEEVKGGSTGAAHTCFLVAAPSSNSGSVACAGRNASGQLGDGDFKDAHIAVSVEIPEAVTAVAAGDLHTCALGVNGNIYCWGINDLGQLGASRPEAKVNFAVEAAPFSIPPSDDLKAVSIAAGSSHTCAVYEGGYVGCWGSGDFGQLGDGNSGDGFSQPNPFPVLVFLNDEYAALSGVTQVAAGFRHTCALVAGSVQCWGSNDSMQLGIPTNELELSAEPVTVPGLEGLAIEEITASGWHTCARAGSTVVCWGGNVKHQLGAADGLVGPVTTIPLPDDVYSIAAGRFFTCALTRSKSAFCWGSNDFGERGVANAPLEPSAIPISDITGIFTGRGNHLCITKQGGGSWCLGQDNWGQLADDEPSPEPQPVPSPVHPLAGTQTCER